MSEISRRRFIRNGAIAAAAAGTVAAVPSIIGTATADADPRLAAPRGTPAAATAIAAPAAPAKNSTVLAHVVDPASGLIAVYVGTRQIDIHDPGMARALTAIAGE